MAPPSYPAIITTEQFDRVQALLKAKRPTASTFARRGEIASSAKSLRLISVSEDIYKDAVHDVERMMKEREELAALLARQDHEEQVRLQWATAVDAALAGLGSPEMQEAYLWLGDRIDLRWERVPPERQRGQYRLAGGFITY